MRNTTVERIFVWIIKAGLFIIPFLPLYISPSMLFPFITGKNFAFRIIVEFIFVFWVALLVAWPKYRSSLTPLFKISCVFIVTLFLADLLSPNPLRSFFSNYERMEGFMMIFHLWLYFMVLISVLRQKKEWMAFLHVMFAGSFLVALVGLLQKFGYYSASIQGGFRIDSTIGNPAYLASYLTFNLWILLLFLREYWENWLLRIVYALAFLFELWIIILTATRGTTVALVIGIPVLLLLLIVYWKRAFPLASTRVRTGIIIFLAVFILAPIVFWQFRNLQSVRANPLLNRFASISLDDKTTQSRFAIWRMSLKGIAERPILGWGQENYYLVFQKYFDPKLFASEPWFDRSHNLFLDWLVDAGVVGGSAFFALWGAAFWFLWKSLQRRTIDPLVAIILFVGLLAHFIEDIFVFDNLNTYIFLFAFFAYIDFVTFPREIVPSRLFVPNAIGRAFTTSGVLLAVFFLLLYPVHIKPIRASQALLLALQMNASRVNPDQIIAAFKAALAYDSFGTTEIREQLGQMTRSVLTDEKYTPEQKKQMFDLAIEELRKQVDTPARDVKHMIFLASILSSAANIVPGYAAEAEQILRDAIHISPTKQITYFELGQLYLRTGRTNEAIDILRKAVLLEPSFVAAKVNLIIAASALGRDDVGEEFRGTFDLRELSDAATLERLGLIYRKLGHYQDARDVYDALATISYGDAKIHAVLAALMAQSGDYANSKIETKIAIGLDSAYAEEGVRFLQLIAVQEGAQKK